jgi:hypothetical protein
MMPEYVSASPIPRVLLTPEDAARVDAKPHEVADLLLMIRDIDNRLIDLENDYRERLPPAEAAVTAGDGSELRWKRGAGHFYIEVLNPTHGYCGALRDAPLPVRVAACEHMDALRTSVFETLVEQGPALRAAAEFLRP